MLALGNIGTYVEIKERRDKAANAFVLKFQFTLHSKVTSSNEVRLELSLTPSANDVKIKKVRKMSYTN